MNSYRIRGSVMILALLLLLPCWSSAQTWKFIKEKDGVQLYTRHETGRGLKLFKGIAEMNIPADKIFALLENVNRTDWWTKDVTQIKVLFYEKYKRAGYYLVYRLPWPFKDRDLCVNVTSTIDRPTGESRLIAVPSGSCVENSACVRVKDYWQEWKIRPIDKNRSRVELEFYINPGTSLPNWLINMVLSDSPIKVIRTMRKYLQADEASVGVD